MICFGREVTPALAKQSKYSQALRGDPEARRGAHLATEAVAPPKTE